ncbi:rhamnulokinase [Mycolicibacterium madagascariense]|uniref:Rhamnulokinase n=1 Tax=Mycolicibacterium madagascariense TaxID=212765 RepID=A0A7I7XHP3_9MYCO|nr:rhamnulokinase family protein [Mycolicibacterium madagascariense]MCV7016063.1 rhamnulokinase [Mycolicibacterium madagascariense]BBZ28726.1 rhamnulokinase [Mycolicibacterium madagascariense]
MTDTGTFAAIDLGATSGRVMVAEVGPGVLSMREVSRFANDPVYLWNGTRTAMHWDLPGLFAGACAGLAEAARATPGLVSVGVDSWAVDYGLLRDGKLLGLPYHYRDARCAAGAEAVHARLSQERIFARNGLQFLDFNTMFQLAADAAEGMLDVADQALLIPDLIGYWLTGAASTERTNASTTGLLGVDGRWDVELEALLGLPAGLFPGLADPGAERGRVLPELAARVGLPAGLPVTTVASHDTASALVAIPMDAGSAAYVSCGTWALVGVELDDPVLSAAARTANFTNEVGADGRIRFLRNVMGLWILSESVRRWQRDGSHVDLAALLDQAAACPPTAEVFDGDDPRFVEPGDMPGRIGAWYAERGLPAPASRPELVRAIVESLAAGFARGVEESAALSGIPVETVHLVGGGARNRLLCQLLADRVARPVIAGPVEATAIGNVLIQARSHGSLQGDLTDLRGTMAPALAGLRFEPRPSSRRRAPAGRV